MFCLFLFTGQGLDSVEGRLEYGFKASKEDIRWTLYSDSFEMLKDNPVFGVGFSAWEAEYPRYMNPELADVIPEYLHSDPLQILSELGIVGVLPLVILCAYLFLQVLRSKVSGADAILINAITVSLIGFLVASCFDFPFRIPAISYLFCLLIAYLCFLLDQTEDSQKS